MLPGYSQREIPYSLNKDICALAGVAQWLSASLRTKGSPV